MVRQRKDIFCLSEFFSTGETKYVIDLPDLPFQLYGALVLAKAPANSVIRKINPDGALVRYTFSICSTLTTVLG